MTIGQFRDCWSEVTSEIRCLLECDGSVCDTAVATNTKIAQVAAKVCACVLVLVWCIQVSLDMNMVCE